MELIDDWKDKTPQPASPDGICEALKAFKPRVASVHCYEDVGYPWVQVVFEEVIHPEVALRLGDALAAEATEGASSVHFNSLRPRAVYFLVGRAFKPDPGKQLPELPISRYGEPVPSLKKAWK